MHAYSHYLEPLQSQEKSMLDLLEKWVAINSWSENPEGLHQMAKALEQAFSSLHPVIEHIPLPPRQKIDAKGNPLVVPASHMLSFKKKHPNTKYNILLAGHLDTVYPPSSPFQKMERFDAEMLRGPGTADMKGGLVIMLKALETFEKSPFANQLSWEVLINPDEEIGSPSSEQVFLQKAADFNVGLIFEPAFPDGSLVNERKGSINYTIVARGKSAHAGRDYYSGRNAIIAMSRFVQGVETLNDQRRGITVNVGSFDGGGPVNIVPDLAICKLNIRMQNPKDLSMITSSIHEMVKGCNTPDGITFEYHEQTKRAPKMYNKAHRLLFEALESCGEELGLKLHWQPSGGVCDGNTLSCAGLPTIDTLGAVGGHIHTHDEFILIPSLIERAQLTASFLMHIADNQYILEKSHD